MMFRKIAILILVISAIVALAACKATDVVGKISVTSFEALLDKMSDNVSFNEEGGRWVLESPGGEKFEWSKDFSSDKPDIAVEFDAAPFLDAGLEVEKLPQGKYIYDEATGRVQMPYEFGQNKFSYTGEAAPLETFKKIVDAYRESIGYHDKFDHYGISLGNGNMFEWAKDLSKNDKDIVFVLNPQPFIEAGVNPDKVEGWLFAKVEIMNKQGKMEEVDKLLKIYELN